jgi:hypothetical protein
LEILLCIDFVADFWQTSKISYRKTCTRTQKALIISYVAVVKAVFSVGKPTGESYLALVCQIK